MMTTQPVLPGFAQPEVVECETLEQRTDRWLALNPWVLDELERLADERIGDGVPRFGVKALVERLRWDWSKGRTEGDHWRLNNSYTSRLARRLIERRPEFADYIETRELKAA